MADHHPDRRTRLKAHGWARSVETTGNRESTSRTVVLAHVDFPDPPEYWVVIGDPSQMDVVDLDGIPTLVFSNGFLVENFDPNNIELSELAQLLDCTSYEWWIGYD